MSLFCFGKLGNEQEVTAYTWVYSISNYRYVKQTIGYMKPQINPNIIILSDFNTPFAPTDRLYRQNKQRNLNNK